MIKIVYIASHILYEHHLYGCILWGFCAGLKEACGCTTSPTRLLWNALPLFNQLVFQFVKFGSLEGIGSCTRRPTISDGWSIGDGSGVGSRPLVKSAYQKYFFYFSTKTYVVGTQKNRLNETVLLSTQNICKN